MLTHDPNDTKPCPHMRLLVSALADEALAGLARWYTRWHLDGCAQCQKGLATILAVRGRLRLIHEDAGEKASLSPEQWAAVEAAWLRAEHTHSPPSP